MHSEVKKSWALFIGIGVMMIGHQNQIQITNTPTPLVGIPNLKSNRITSISNGGMIVGNLLCRHHDLYLGGTSTDGAQGFDDEGFGGDRSIC